MGGRPGRSPSHRFFEKDRRWTALAVWLSQFLAPSLWERSSHDEGPSLQICPTLGAQEVTRRCEGLAGVSQGNALGSLLFSRVTPFLWPQGTARDVTFRAKRWRKPIYAAWHAAGNLQMCNQQKLGNSLQLCNLRTSLNDKTPPAQYHPAPVQEAHAFHQHCLASVLQFAQALVSTTTPARATLHEA